LNLPVSKNKLPFKVAIFSNFLEDISDHLPGVVLQLKSKHQNKLPRPFVRIFSEKHIKSFTQILQATDWSCVYNEMDDDLSFKKFSELITDAFNRCFYLTRLSRKRSRDKKNG
jgi:hypothetical protein